MEKRPKVYLTQSIPREIINKLTDVCDVTVYDETNGGGMKIPRECLLAAVKGVDVLHVVYLPAIDREVLEAAGQQLKLIAVQSAGVDHIDLEECRRRNIRVTHTPDVLTGAVAEGTIALMLATARRFKEGMGFAAKGNMGAVHTLHGKDIQNAVIGIVGLGRIGTAVAKRLLAFDVSEILYSGPNPRARARDVSAQFVSLDELLRRSDFVIVACPANPGNNKMFDKSAFSKMKPDAVFINIARGSLVDQDALFVALTNGTILAAGLDVTSPEPIPPNHPLVFLPNCTVLPHLAAATVAARTAMADLCVRNIMAWMRGEPLITPVNDVLFK